MRTSAPQLEQTSGSGSNHRACSIDQSEWAGERRLRVGAIGGAGSADGELRPSSRSRPQAIAALRSSAGGAPGPRDPGRRPGSEIGHRGVEGEAGVLPGEHLADVIGLDQTATGEPPQHPAAHLFKDRCDGFRRQWRRRPEPQGCRDTAYRARLLRMMCTGPWASASSTAAMPRRLISCAGTTLITVCGGHRRANVSTMWLFITQPARPGRGMWHPP